MTPALSNGAKPPKGFDRWEITWTVQLDKSHRRAIAQKLGVRGLVSQDQFEELVLDLIEEWVTDAFQNERVRMPRRRRKKPVHRVGEESR